MTVTASRAQLDMLASLDDNERGTVRIEEASTDGATTTLLVHTWKRGFSLYSDGSTDNLDDIDISNS